ncbi:MAG: 30S ribosomal protein S6 [Oscillospiraceae bacterium]|jgi:small subunit ribosomal protein S6|nr:30S ribosomal protein S6 [Oscillospiraceae bacterium]
MAKLSEKYEALIVYSVKSGEEQVETLKTKFADLITAHSTLVKTDIWGSRKLAYEINKETEGYYVIYNFDGDPQFPKELERVLGITEGILRYMVIKRQSD